MILPGQKVAVIPNRCCLTGDTAILVGDKVLYLRDISAVLKDGVMQPTEEVCVFPIDGAGNAAILDTPRTICFEAPGAWIPVNYSWRHPNGSILNTRYSGGSSGPDEFVFAAYKEGETEKQGLFYMKPDPWGEIVWEHEGMFYQPSYCGQTSGGAVILVVDDWHVRDCYLNGNIYEGVDIWYENPMGHGYPSYVACNGETRPNLLGPVEDVKYFPFAIDWPYSSAVWHSAPFPGYWDQKRWYTSTIQIVDELVTEKTASLPAVMLGRVWDMCSAENSSVYFSNSYDYATWYDWAGGQPPPFVTHRVYVKFYKLTWIEEPTPHYSVSLLYSWDFARGVDLDHYSRFVGKTSLLWNWAENTWILTYHNYRFNEYAPIGWVICYEEGVGKKWEREFELVIDHCCFGGGGIILATSTKMYSLDRVTGVTNWENDPPAGSSYCTAPISIVNHYYIGTTGPNRIIKYDLSGNYVSERNTIYPPTKLAMLKSETAYVDFTFIHGDRVCRFRYN